MGVQRSDAQAPLGISASCDRLAKSSRLHVNSSNALADGDTAWLTVYNHWQLLSSLGLSFEWLCEELPEVGADALRKQLVTSGTFLSLLFREFDNRQQSWYVTQTLLFCDVLCCVIFRFYLAWHFDIFDSCVGI